MSNNLDLIKRIRDENRRLSSLIDKEFIEILNKDDSDFTFKTHDLNTSFIRKIKKTIKSLSFKQEESNSIYYAINLIHKKKNREAVQLLMKLSQEGLLDASLRLGKIFFTGLRNRIGELEFKNPRASAKHLQTCFDKGVGEAGYLLGVLFLKFGKAKNAKKIFYTNHKNGCVRSSAELIILLQCEIAEKTLTPKEEAIIRQQIANIKADISYK
ncbi:hypothetical protein [Photobacterium kishitanii]|uniref:Sel1 repeat family protein n=1 Tax=Photobacterium kishitanii TaxID=318456 RepID=A0A2T3KN40_9GAMM|nr:hypothetical protein [Photobacterium kishitanii]PSV01192.1 hypothetical protein C9J27_03980 [Photobacterium kishitanii]